MSNSDEYWVDELEDAARPTWVWIIAMDDQNALHIWQTKNGDDLGRHVLGSGMNLREALAAAFGWM